mmetsp:Transcript_81751/g.227606  ORF Transcript_81751/g.227606 Transcript_81751/m.227606 type:complete len:214 (-) Transcript_81751:500-1141(-)
MASWEASAPASASQEPAARWAPHRWTGPARPAAALPALGAVLGVPRCHRLTAPAPAAPAPPGSSGACLVAWGSAPQTSQRELLEARGQGSELLVTALARARRAARCRRRPRSQRRTQASGCSCNSGCRRLPSSLTSRSSSRCCGISTRATDSGSRLCSNVGGGSRSRRRASLFPASAPPLKSSASSTGICPGRCATTRAPSSSGSAASSSRAF